MEADVLLVSGGDRLAAIALQGIEMAMNEHQLSLGGVTPGQ
jgi:hypothetical protein